MPLRDFERVRERLELRVEVRHLYQLGAGLAALLVLAFLGGYWVGSARDGDPPPPAPTPVEAPAPVAAAPEPVAPTPEAPILPRTVAGRGAPARGEPTEVAEAPADPVEGGPAVPAVAEPDEEDPEVTGRSDPPTAVRKAFHLQIRAFRDETEARALHAELKARGHAPVLSSIEVPGKGRFWRLRLGPFATLDETRAAQRRFESVESLPTMILVDP